MPPIGGPRRNIAIPFGMEKLDGEKSLMIYTVSQKNCAFFLFLSELRQISTKFNKFWQVDGKVFKIVWYINILHLT